jgi:molecular chaperone DnaK
MPNDYILGIDLGTTFSTAAYVDEHGDAIAIPNADGKLVTPSAVLIKDGEIVVGEPALNHWVTDQEHVVRWVKRAMGRTDYTFQGLTPVEISAEILKQLKADGEAFLNTSLQRAVVTCPAYFAAVEIENTKKAGELAGFQVKEVVKEPTAASVYYGVENMQDGERVLVCDLGGGTYDATLLAYENGIFTPLASAGSRILGGHDWTMDLVGLVTERYLAEFGDDPSTDLVAAQVLYEECEQAKRQFSRQERVSVACSYQGQRGVYTISRDEFEMATEWRIQELVMYTEDALRKAQMGWQDVNTILLVGGSSRLRRMALGLKEASGITPSQSNKPDLAVALGAAILAKGQVRRRKPAGGLVEMPSGGLIEVIYKRIIARSLGTRVIAFEQDHQPYITNSLIIPHSTEAPVTRSREDYEISLSGQEYFEIPVVEFESDDDYEPIDNYRFTCLPGAKQGNRIRVTFHYDESGIPTVEAVDLSSGQPLEGERLPYEEPDVEALKVVVRPRWVVFAIDVSWSMEGAKLKNAREALIDNARQLLQQGGERTKVGIVSFSTQAQIVCEPTHDLDKVIRAARGLQAQALTAMDDGINLAVEMVSWAPQGVDRDVVMLTDGMPDSAKKQATVQSARRARESGITLSSIGVGKQEVDLDFLKSLTPLSLVIEASGNMSEAMGKLLTQSAANRGGLIERGSSLEEL